MNSYELSRKWFDWCFENPEKISPNHSAMYFFIIEHCNRLGWKSKFGLPMEMTKDAIGMKNYRTYTKTFNDLVEWGFIEVVQKSKNQYSSCIVAIVKNTKATSKALDKALQTHNQKQGKSIVCIDKPINNITKKQYNSLSFDSFWNIYDKKTDKAKCEIKFNKLSFEDKEKIKLILPKYINSTPDVKFRKNPLTWLNGKCWNDEVEDVKSSVNQIDCTKFNPYNIGV